MSSGIYCYTNKINNKKYVGQSSNLKRRKREHRHKSNNLPFYRALKKYGESNFDYEVLEFCDIVDLDKKEVYYIQKLNTKTPNGYNLDSGGYHRSNKVYSEKQILKVQDLLVNTNLSHQQIVEETGVELSYVSKIRNGHYQRNNKFQYPLRPKSFREKEKFFCKDCGNEIASSKALRCFECNNIKKRKIERPEPLQLAKEIVESSFVAVGKKYGVSDNAIKKWCKSYGIPHLKNDLSK